jgi:hypothetical protein
MARLVQPIFESNGWKWAKPDHGRCCGRKNYIPNEKQIAKTILMLLKESFKRGEEWATGRLQIKFQGKKPGWYLIVGHGKNKVEFGNLALKRKNMMKDYSKECKYILSLATSLADDGLNQDVFMSQVESFLIIAEGNGRKSQNEQMSLWKEGVDAGIKDLVAALNKAGIKTDHSCDGHGRQGGYVHLVDGRQLIVLTPEMQKKLRIEGPLSLEEALKEVREMETDVERSKQVSSDILNIVVSAGKEKNNA